MNFRPRLKILSLFSCLLISACCAFARSFEVRDSVLVISADVTKILPHQFEDRADFHTVSFENRSRLSEIGDYAFLGCHNLRSIALPSSLRKLGQGTFRECDALREITLPEAITVIPRYAFAWCRNLTRVNLRGKITDLQAHAFAYCHSLKNFNFPPSLLHIGSNAFSFCSSLEEISLPASITELESYAFSECISLRQASLPANSHLLGELIFSGCRALQSITELSPIPPRFDCESTLFEPTEQHLYRQCTLHVPANSINAYRQSPAWSLFPHIL